MTQTYAPFAAGPGSTVGQDLYLDYLGPMLNADGVNTKVFGDSTLQVYANSSGLQSLMRAGSGLVRGVAYQNTADVAVAHSTNVSGSTRIDRVVLRNDRAHSGGGLVSPVVITGTPGAGAPAVVQTTGGIWDLPLARVSVGSGVAVINPSDVTDERQYLPLPLFVVDSSTTGLPPSNGSKGWVCYDKAAGALLITDGTQWLPALRQVYTTVNMGAGIAIVESGTVATARKLNGVVEMAFDRVLSGGTSGGVVATLPAGYRPSASVDGYFTNAIASDGHYYIATDGTINVQPNSGTILVPGYHLKLHATYLAA